MYSPAADDVALQATGHRLDPVFQPRSIAVIGASSDPRKIGGRPIAYMLRSGYAGPLYPVNPGQAEVQGIPAYPSLASIGGPVDQVVIAVGGAYVAAAVEDAIANQARSIVIFSSGFAEIDEAGRERQQAIAARCKAAGVHLMGPNCIGVFNARQSSYSTFMTALEHQILEAGSVGIVSQSGAVGSYLYGLAGDRGLRFSHFVATGNEAGLDVADCIEWMAHAADTRVIMAYIEGSQDGDKLYHALDTARRQKKPVILLKVGRSEQGAAAAASHTGSLAGSDNMFDAIFRETGTWRARSMEEMVDLAYACSISPLPRGNRLGVITPSGGVGVIAADEASDHGLVLPTLPMELQAQIKAVIPLGSGVNPVDVTGGTVSDRSMYTRVLDLVCDYDGFDSIMSFNASMGRSAQEFAKVSDALFAARSRHPDRPMALSMRATPEIVGQLESQGILHFADPARATTTLAAMAEIARSFDQPTREQPLAKRVQDLPSGALDEAQARNLLETQGVPFAAQRVAHNADEAVQAAEALGWPVVMKVVSADIAHKSDVGGVALGLTDAEHVREAWSHMMQRVGTACPEARIDGVLVSPMIKGGVETVIGTVRDPVFGPMVMFGLGGVFVEIFKDVTFRRAPVSTQTALEMIHEIRALPLLTGARGKPPVDLQRLAEAISAVSVFAAAHKDEVASVEVNPFIALPKGGCAVDALILR